MNSWMAASFSGPGGQVIVSAAVKSDGDVALRVRDTGVGMSEEELQIALRPFPQSGADASVPSLPLTKMLAEANHASFAISSKIDEGTLIEVTFAAAAASA